MAQASDIVTYKFKLNDTANRPVSSLAVSLQFFQASTRTWEEVYSGMITDGVFLFSETLTRTAYSVFLRESIVPEVRIVTVAPYYSLQKPEVLAFTCQFSSAPSGQVTNFLFDFGESYIVEKPTVIAADIFSAFVVITSQFSLVNQELLKTQIQSLTADLAACKASNTKLLTENKLQAEEIAALKAEIQSKDATITALNAQLAEALAQVEQQTLQITQLTAVNQEQAATIAELQLQIAQLTATNQEQAAAIAALQLQVAQLTATNQEQAATIAALQLQVEELQAQIVSQNPIPVKTLYENLVREIDASTQNSRDSGYKLANISLKLKTLVTSDENGINAQLLGLNEMDQVNGAAVSELVFDIAPSIAPASQTGRMPNLLGLTETAVRRITESVGLRLNPVYQNNPVVMNGDSFKQSPAEGAIYNNNDFVTVIFSKHE